MPSYLDRYAINIIFDGLEKIDFIKFGAGFILFKLFSFYDKDFNFSLEKQEFLELFNDI